MNMATHKEMKQLVAAIARGEGEEKKTYWTRIGVAFTNKDGSMNLKFDFPPADLTDTTIQLRDYDRKDKE